MSWNDPNTETDLTVRSTLQLPVDAFGVVISDGADGVAIVTKDHSGPLPGPGRTSEEHHHAVSRECSWLRAAEGIPGVVDLVERESGNGTAAVTTVFAGGQTLRSARLTPVDTAHALEGVGQSLAELQERNLNHGAITPEHVIIASDGRGVLCSPNTSLNPDEHVDDLAALGQCITFCLDRWAREATPPANLSLWLVLAKRLEERDPVMSARRATTMVSELTMLAPVDSSVRRRGWRVVAVIVLVSVLALVAARFTRNDPVTGPQLQVRDALVRVGTAGNIAIALEPPVDCPGSEIYVLDPATSWVWTFDDIHAPSPGKLLVQIAGATGLAVDREKGPCPVVIASGPAGQVQVPTGSRRTE
ncbi:MAG: hypothetical protein HKN03_06645 [Acidimicrobiales bacterium]|nr:hypothetical protein [Acidimicrobiales bacterium]